MNFCQSWTLKKIVCEAEQMTRDSECDNKQMRHFPEPVTKDTMTEMSKRKFSNSTKKKAQWAGQIFEQWKYIQNYKLKQGKLDKIIDYNLINIGTDQMNEVLSFFLMEIRKQNGEEYPHETLYEIVLSLQHYMAINRCDIKLLDHPGLVCMHNTLDNSMKELSKQGVIRERSQAKPITVDEEDKLWKSGLLGDDMPERLVNTLLYLIGVHFTLCTYEEHKCLKVGGFSQFKLKFDYDCDLKYLEYIEYQSKNHQGGLKSLHNKPKVVCIFQNKENPERCLV